MKYLLFQENYTSQPKSGKILTYSYGTLSPFFTSDTMLRTLHTILYTILRVIL